MQWVKTMGFIVGDGSGSGKECLVWESDGFAHQKVYKITSKFVHFELSEAQY